MKACLAIIALFCALPLHLRAQEPSPWAEFIQPEFPFLCQVLDARDIGETWPNDNLTPRGILINIGSGHWACFDPDMLRISLVWKQPDGQPPITLNSMAPGSWQAHLAGKKSPGGQAALPQPQGQILFATPILPGWAKPGKTHQTDPRPRIDPNEPGVGPLETSYGEFRGIAIHAETSQPILRYTIFGTEIEETWNIADRHIIRTLNIAPHAEPFQILNGPEVPASDTPQTITVQIETAPLPDAKWSTTFASVTTQTPQPADNGSAYQIETLPLPTANSDQRNVRLSGLDFFRDGRAAFCTFDGDVWLCQGLHEPVQTWHRFASGLQEPMSLQIVENEIYVFGRTCIWKLHDQDNNLRCDFYENFCNRFSQTAESREFASDMKKIPGGGFYIAKAGQRGNSPSHHEGCILKISADGKNVEVIARGLRQPFIGLDETHGHLTSSDQQGHWIPSTPLHLISSNTHLGFLPTNVEKHPQPVTEPFLWIPHFVNQSGSSQVTNHDPRFGPLSGNLLHFGFNRPELFRVYRDENQGAISSLLTGFDSGLLNAAINPVDGQLYLCGFRIWGTIAEEVSGLYRIRHQPGGNLEIPEDVRSDRRGIYVRFPFEVDETIASAVGNYEVDRWNYKRTSGYGSGAWRPDGEPGQEAMPVSSVIISEDKRGVFIGIPDMQPVQQMRLTYRLPNSSETPQIRSTYLTVHELREMDLNAAGFGDAEIDLTPPAGDEESIQRIVSVEEGERLSTAFGCIACHSIDGTVAEKVGPSWKGIYGQRRTFTDGSEVRKADEIYLREAILDPAARVVEGFDGEGVGMPSYLGILKNHQIDSIILYIRSLKD